MNKSINEIVTLVPKKGDCCVFCSYADTKCPPRQMEATDKYA